MWFFLSNKEKLFLLASRKDIAFLDVKLQTVLTGNLAVLQDLFYALILIVLVIYNNAPALKGFRGRYNIKNLIVRFKKNDPSNIRDDEAKWDRVPTKIKMDEVLSVDLQTTSPYTPDKSWDSSENKPGKENN